MTRLCSVEVLRQLLRYEPETGKLFWKERPVQMFEGGKYPAERLAKIWNTKHAGQPALDSEREHGYLGGHVLRVFVYAHRVAWAIHYGDWPSDQIDHDDGDRANNRIANLLDASDASNRKNMGMRSDNSSGFCGVEWHRQNKNWVARIKVNKQGIHLGCFPTFEEAVEARKAANRKYGFTERHGT